MWEPHRKREWPSRFVAMTRHAAEITPRNKVRIGRRSVAAGESASGLAHENSVIVPLVRRRAPLVVGGAQGVGLDQPALTAGQQEARFMARGRNAAAVIQLASPEKAPGAHVPIGDEPALRRRRRDDAAAGIGGDRADIVAERLLRLARRRNEDRLLSASMEAEQRGLVGFRDRDIGSRTPHDRRPRAQDAGWRAGADRAPAHAPRADRRW